MSRQLGARAFTVGNQVFFGKDQFRPDSRDGRELIAHELTHTIQQGAVAQRDLLQCHSATHDVDATVAHHEAPGVQRVGLSDVLGFFADRASLIPGFRMFTVALGVNPLNMQAVDRSPANILRACVEFIPGGALVSQVLVNHGVFDRVALWVAQQLVALGMIGGEVRQRIDAFLDSVSIADLFNLGGVWARAREIFTSPINRLTAFVRDLAGGILRFVREAVLLPLARLAQGMRGYALLCAVLGEDPVTGQPVAQTAEALIGGFMRLIGQEEIWRNMQRAQAVTRAMAWFRSSVMAVVSMARRIPSAFVVALTSLEIIDFAVLPRAFARVVGAFGGFVGSFITWAGDAMWSLLEIIVESVSPGALGYIRRTGAALRSILLNPLPFVQNLVRAAKDGFLGFAGNFLRHLRLGLIEWLTGSLPGVYIPATLTLQEIVKFVLSVLGISWQHVRQKLVRVVGESAVTAMETGFEIVVTLVRHGPVAAWDQIKEQLSNLKDSVISGITNFVLEAVVGRAIPKLVAMFIPGVGFVSALLSIYDTVMVFVSRLSSMVQVVTGFVSSIVDIAAGRTQAAAARVESMLARLLSLAINFFAGFVGRGRVADMIMGMVGLVRAFVDRALDRLVAWIVLVAKRLFRSVRSAATRVLNWFRARAEFADSEGHSHTLFVDASGTRPRMMVASTPVTVMEFIDAYFRGRTPDFISSKQAKRGKVETALVAAQRALDELVAADAAGRDESEKEPLLQKLLGANVVVADMLRLMIGDSDLIVRTVDKYALEGITGTYESMPKPSGDEFEADHQPQAAVFVYAADLPCFKADGAHKLRDHAAGRARKGYAINLQRIRHHRGRTGRGSSGPLDDFKKKVERALPGIATARAQREFVILCLRQEVELDAKAIYEVIEPTSVWWNDINTHAGLASAKAKTDLIERIRKRIIHGERELQAQNLKALID